MIPAIPSTSRPHRNLFRIVGSGGGGAPVPVEGATPALSSAAGLPLELLVATVFLPSVAMPRVTPVLVTIQAASKVVPSKRARVRRRPDALAALGRTNVIRFAPMRARPVTFPLRKTARSVDPLGPVRSATPPVTRPVSQRPTEVPLHT